MKHIIYLLSLVIPSLAISQKIEEPTDPKKTERWEPIPPVVSLNTSGVPSDAIVLFDGKTLNKWQHPEGSAANWSLRKDGSMEVKKGTGDIETKRKFGSIQLHLEWRTPKKMKENGQGRGNSGVYLQGLYEIQILDNYKNRTYSNGQASALYKQYAPLVNACKEPGEWQTYDIIFHAPKFGSLGQITKNGHITVLHNGILTQDNVKIIGSTEYMGWPKNKPHGKGPIRLQDHGHSIGYRNIWVREL